MGTGRFVVGQQTLPVHPPHSLTNAQANTRKRDVGQFSGFVFEEEVRALGVETTHLVGDTHLVPWCAIVGVQPLVCNRWCATSNKPASLPPQAEQTKVKDRLSKQTLGQIHKLMELLDMPQGTGDKAAKIQRVVEFLEKPSPLSSVDLATKEAKKKEAAKRKRERGAAKKGGGKKGAAQKGAAKGGSAKKGAATKKAAKKEEEGDDEEEEDVEEVEESEDESEEEAETPPPKPARKRQAKVCLCVLWKQMVVLLVCVCVCFLCTPTCTYCPHTTGKTSIVRQEIS